MATTKKETEVQKEDQAKINQFSRLNVKFHEVDQEIKLKKEEVEALEDAETLIDEAMGENVLLRIGECFVEVDDDYAKGYHTQLAERAKKDLENMNDTKGDLEKQMKELRAHLYARFGANINLEEES